MTGHLLSAAGGIEVVATVLALHHGVIPPTTNYDAPDPECDLDYNPNRARQTEVRVAFSNSSGLAGPMFPRCSSNIRKAFASKNSPATIAHHPIAETRYSLTQAPPDCKTATIQSDIAEPLGPREDILAA